MTPSERDELEKTVLHQAVIAERDYKATRVALALKGDSLVLLGLALQESPESVRPLAEPLGPDYSAGLNLLNCRQEIILLCDKLRSLRDARTVAERRKSSLGLA
jgi:hypothetical protein